MKPLIIIISILLITTSPLTAQPVKAILVQLNTEQNKIKYFKKSGSNKDVENISADAAAMRKKMISDINDNFGYCPAYYYMDTNASLIENKQFKDVLLNADGTPVKEPIVSAPDSNYLIVRYGFTETNTAVRSSKGLAVCNDKLKQLFFFEHTPEVTLKQYLYTSKKYEIEYYPCAKELDQKIRRKYDE